MNRTLTSRMRLALFVLGLLIVIGVTGCRKPAGFFGQARAGTSTTTSGEPRDLGKEAITTVEDYLTALNAPTPDYDRAYQMLSRASQSQYSRGEFEKQCKQGMPQFYFKTGRSTIMDDTATVELRQIEDPATHAFQLVREDDAWKIVYRGGAPGMPYAE